MNEVTVIIPVYNAFQEAIECLKSVQRHTAENVRVRVYDDGSREGDFAERVNSRQWPKLEVIRNEHNLGFTKSCNRGIREAAPHDVVLLNSDTIVSEGWLEGLQEAAYHDHRVGTVTPLTNNGTVCSIPNWMVENPIPEGFTIDSFATLVRSVGAGKYPIIPTCVGFCAYLKREAIEAAGAFDEKAFPRGYGEENDLSLRMQAAGYVDVLDDRTFVYHAGSRSFQDENRALREQGSAVIQQRYPHYFDNVSRFVRDQPLQSIHDGVHAGIIESFERSRNGRVLHILHNGPYRGLADPVGGTERALQRIIAKEREHTHWSLVCWKGSLILTFCTPGFQKEYRFSENELSQICDPDIFPVIHVHHMRWFNRRALIAALERHGNVVTSLHDFVTICPRFHLFTTAGTHCSGRECTSVCGYRPPYISEYREEGLALLNLSKKVFAFSKNTVGYIERILGWRGETALMPHGIEIDRTECAAPVEPPLTLRVAVLGVKGRHKGEELFHRLFRESGGSSNLEWHCFGEESLSADVICHGTYTGETLPEMVKAARPHCFLFLSHCPETYSIAVDEAAALTVPVVVGPYGAPAERVEQFGIGWVLPELTLESVFDTLEQVRSEWAARREELLGNLRSYPTRDTEWEAAHLSEQYQQLGSRQKRELSALLKRGKTGQLRVGGLGRLSAAALDLSVRMLDRFQLRYRLQSLLSGLLPPRLYQQLRQIRGMSGK